MKFTGFGVPRKTAWCGTPSAIGDYPYHKICECAIPLAASLNYGLTLLVESTKGQNYITGILHINIRTDGTKIPVNGSSYFYWSSCTDFLKNNYADKFILNFENSTTASSNRVALFLNLTHTYTGMKFTVLSEYLGSYGSKVNDNMWVMNDRGQTTAGQYASLPYANVKYASFDV